MYVCLCKQVTDRDIRSAVRDGASCMRDLNQRMGVGTVALGLQSTQDAAGVLPETRTAIALSQEIDEGTSLSFEVAMDDDYSTADGGTGESATSFTAQLAVEF